MMKLQLVLLGLGLAVLVGCGGGGGGTPAASGGSNTLTGTAATGAAIANATITIKGANGVSKTGTTTGNGSYSIDVTGLTAPYLIQVVYTGGTLYSVGEQTGTVNIHPLTDLIIRTWYDVVGTPIDTAFGDPVAAPPPSATELGVIVSVIEKLVQKWLVDAGLNVATFDLITTPFTADSTGFDGFLDTLAVDAASGVISVDTLNSSAVEQTTTLDLDADKNGTLGDISANTTIIVDGITSTSFTSAYIPTTAAEQAALDGVLATLSTLAGTINTKGMALTAADLLPYYDVGYMSRGRDRDQDAAGFAADMAGATLNSFTIDRVLSLDAASGIISIAGRASITQGGITVEEIVDEDGDGFIFKMQVDGSWLMHGNQEHVRASVDYITENRYMGSSCTGCSGLYYALSAQVGAASGVVSSATIDGPISGATPPLALTKVPLTFFEDDGTPMHHFDLMDTPPYSWFYQVSPANFAPAGSVYTFNVNFADGSTGIYTRTLGASSSESFALTGTPPGYDFNAIKNTLVTLSWNLPVSFPIQEVYMYGFVSNGTDGCHIEVPRLAVTATSGSITLPDMCQGQPLQAGSFPSISIVVEGVNGEKSSINYMFQ